VSDFYKSIQAAIELARRLKQLSEKLRDVELKNMAADLSLQLADVKVRLAEVLDENGRLKARLLLFESHSSRAEALVIRGGLYFSNSGDGPFCTHCYDTKQKVIRLTKEKAPFNQFGDYKCPSCKEYFNE